MNWFIIAILAYFLLGLGNTFDKLVVTKYLSTPGVYAFLVGALQAAAVLILIPFGFEWPGMGMLFFDFLAGAIFVLAVFSLYSALKHRETSRIVPAIDSTVAIFALLLAAALLGEQLSLNQLAAFVFLASGIVLISYEKPDAAFVIKNKFKKLTGKIYDTGYEMKKPYIVLAGFLFALSSVIAKYTYNIQPFMSAFILARLGGFLFSLTFLLSPGFLGELKNNFKQGSAGSNSKAVLLAQVFGGAGFLLQNYAFSLGSVSIISAMQGLKYVFLFTFIFMLGKKFKQLRENWSAQILVQKILAMIFIIAGLLILNL